MNRTLRLTVYGVWIGALQAVLAHLLFRLSDWGLLIAGVVLPLCCGLAGWRVATARHRVPRPFVVIALSPFILVFVVTLSMFFFMIIVALLPVGFVVGIRHEMKLWRHLKSRGRLLRRSELERKLDRDQGSLIVECGPKGPYRLWWTEEESAGKPGLSLRQALQQWTADDQRPEFDSAWKSYLDRDEGKALLVPVLSARRTLTALTRSYPSARLVWAFNI
jgi:hypothetical protein